MKLTKTEKSWILYDVASSAFTMIISTTIPLYFASLAEKAAVESAAITGYYGSATSIAVLILALISPVLGAIADYKGMKLKMFKFSMALAVLGLITFSLAPSWIWFIVFFIVSRLGYSACNVFYDSMLTDVTTDERMDEVSSFGYAWGYIGSCIPFIAGIAILFLMKFSSLAYKLSFIITALWWIGVSIPLIKNVKQTHYLEPTDSPLIKSVFSNLFMTMKEIKRDKSLFYFILAYFFYIDGVYTIISMATAYGSEVGISSVSLILALLLTQFVAFPCAIISGKMGKKFGASKVLKVFIVVYGLICVFAFQLDKAWEFWMLAVIVGMCQGGIQSLSRSYFAKLVPKDRSNEYFGFFDIFGKFADFFGPILISLSAFIFNTSKYGILCIAFLFVIGYFLFNKSEKVKG